MRSSITILILISALFSCTDSLMVVDHGLLTPSDSAGKAIWQNNTSGTILIPHVNGVLPVFKQLVYKIDSCEVVTTGMESIELVMFTTLDTLSVGQSSEYKLSLYNSDFAMKYDSQLIFQFEVYDQDLFDVEPYGVRSTITAFLISYRDGQGKIKVSFLGDGLPSQSNDINISFNPCSLSNE